MYERMEKPTKRDDMPLQEKTSMEPLDRYGAYFVGPIDPISN